MKDNERAPFGKRYRILKEIGQGGGGRVYKVYDTVKAELFALKELSHRHTESHAAILSFKNEFRIMSEFQHPNIVKVFDFGMTRENCPFIVMEFVPGRDLSELSGLSAEKVTDILIQICRGLAVIHSRLYVHRDLKPDNIRYLDDGSVKLLDYGLMSQLGVPASAGISGTYYYLAPEVILGGIIDESTDLYSVGIIGYELLTGQRPFVGTQKEILGGHLKQMPPEPSLLRPDIPPSVNAIILKLLEKDKNRRYQRCSAVLEDLTFLTGKHENIETTALQEGYLYSSKLVGRVREMTDFRNRLGKVQNGKSSALFIGAAAGMGKTRLLREMKILTQPEGIRALYVGTPLAGDPPYGRIRALLRQIIPLSPKEEAEKCEALLSAISGDTPPNPEDFPTSDEALADLLAKHMAALTRRAPLVLFLDDLHRADLKSLYVLNGLIRRKSACRLLIVAGFRNNEVENTSPLWHTVEEGESGYAALAPLNAPQIRTLIEHLLRPSPVSAEFSTYCFNNCGGNGFDLIEFLRYMIAEGHLTKAGDRWQEPVSPETLSLPARLEARLLLRLGKLNHEAGRGAEAASVLGDDLDLEIWQAVSEIPEERLFRAIDELIRNQIVIRHNSRYQFAHDKIRAALYDNLPSARRTDDHLKAAIFLESGGAEKCPERIARVARHFVASGQDAPKAVEYSLRAARMAEENGAEWEAFDHYRDAARFLENDAAWPDREALLTEIYEKAALFSSAAWIDAATCLGWLQKAIDVHTDQGNTEKVFSLSLSYLVSASVTGNYEAARRKVPEIVRTCHVEKETRLWAVLYGAGVCLIDWYQGYQQDCFEHAVTAIAIFERGLTTLPDEMWPAYSWALFWRDKARAYLGQPVEMANVEKIRQLMADERADQTIYWHTLTAVMAQAASTGRWADLLTWKERAAQLSAEMGKIYWFECWISHCYLCGALRHGEFSQSDSHIRRVQASPDPYQVRQAWLFRGLLHLERKEYREAEENLKQFLELEEKGPDNSYPEGLIGLARICLETGKTDSARAYIEKGAGLARKGPCENPLHQLRFLRLKAELALEEGKHDRAGTCLQQSLKLAETLDNPVQTGFIRKLKGRLYLAKGHIREAEEQLSRARDIFLSLENKYQAGQVMELMESFRQKKGEAAEVPSPSADLMETVTDDGDLSLTRQDNSAGTFGESRSAAGSETRTQPEDTDLEQTEIDG